MTIGRWTPGPLYGFLINCTRQNRAPLERLWRAAALFKEQFGPLAFLTAAFRQFGPVTDVNVERFWSRA
jgi:hypothetical protein